MSNVKEVRFMTTEGRWRPDGIVTRIGEIGQEEMPLLGRLKAALAEAET